MSKETAAPSEIITLPTNPGEWEADTKFWMHVLCNVDSTPEPTLKVTPQAETELMNFSIWKDATKFQPFDIQEAE